jgi:hypothetical protein
MTKNTPVIDMTLDGRFVNRTGPTFGMIITRLLMFSLGLCVIAAMFWTMVMVLPAIILLATIGYLFSRIRA